MKLVVAFFLSLVSLAASVQKRPAVCNANNIKPLKCVPGKVRCLPRVGKVTYKNEEITSTSFIAHWDRVPGARCYFIRVLNGDTNIQYKVISCVKGTTYKVTGLRPWTRYELRVSAVNRWCKRGKPSFSVINIKTLWDKTFKRPKPTAKPKRQFTFKVGKCGKGKFTCRSDPTQCIPKQQWCDRRLHCDDGSDERFCPGRCKEIKVDFKNGNYSCSLFSSPMSFCFFDCDEGYLRDGPKSTMCVRSTKRWTNEVPTCRLSYTRILKVIHDETTDTTVTVEWEPVQGAAQYAFQAIEKLQPCDENEEFTASAVVNSTECCRKVISGLKPLVEYRISMWAIDADGLRGMESLPAFFSAVKPKSS